MRLFDTWETNEAGAETLGFEPFNACPHLCVDIPNGESTITVRTSGGKRITFAFLAYAKNGEPQCVDIAHHNPRHGKFAATLNPGTPPRPVQELIAFSAGRTAYQYRTQHGTECHPDNPPTLICLLMEDKPR